MSQRAPIRAGTVLLSVTRPMTAPSFIRRKVQSPNVEIRKKSEFRNLKSGAPRVATVVQTRALGGARGGRSGEPKRPPSPRPSPPGEGVTFATRRRARATGFQPCQESRACPRPSSFGIPSELGIRISALSYRVFLVHHTDDHPADRAFFVAHRGARGRAVRGNDDALMHSGALGIDSHLGRAFGVARRVDRLANEEPPALQAGMLTGGDDVAFDAG